MNICINYRGGNKTAAANINEKNVICKIKRFYVFAGLFRWIEVKMNFKKIILKIAHVIILII